MKGRPRVKSGEESVSVNLRLPQSSFDSFYQYARHIATVEDRDISMAEAVRRFLATPMNAQDYGEFDGREPLEAPFVDALLKHVQSKAIEKLDKALEIANKTCSHFKESVDLSKTLMSELTQAHLEVESLWNVIAMAASHSDPAEGIALLRSVLRPPAEFPN
jgi:exonuclease VII small subunit